ALLSEGLFLSDQLAAEFERAAGVAVTSRLFLELPKNLLCLARVHVGAPGEKAGSRAELVATSSGWNVRREKAETGVTVRPPIESALAGRVLRIGDYVLCDLSRGSFGAALRAHYGMPAEHAEAAPHTADPLLDALETVCRKRTIAAVHLLAYDDPRLPDRESPLSRFAPLFEAIHKNFATAVSIETWPPEGVGVLEQAYAAGLDLLTIPSIAHAGKRAAAAVPERENLSTQRYELAFEAAGEVFEGGAVKSPLLSSAQADESLSRDAKWLAKKGAVPLLWVKPGTSWNEAAALHRELALALEGSGLNFSRVVDSCLQIPPSELKYFHPKQKTLVGAMGSVAQTGLGRAAQRNLSALRRHLRVRGPSGEGH
ncbi:MAG: hypothetical protein AB1405_15825, partial [Bdellovibrionota bacterium]